MAHRLVHITRYLRQFFRPHWPLDAEIWRRHFFTFRTNYKCLCRHNFFVSLDINVIFCMNLGIYSLFKKHLIKWIRKRLFPLEIWVFLRTSANKCNFLQRSHSDFFQIHIKLFLYDRTESLWTENKVYFYLNGCTLDFP